MVALLGTAYISVGLLLLLGAAFALCRILGTGIGPLLRILLTQDGHGRAPAQDPDRRE